MVDLLGLSVAVVAVLFSIYYWWSQNRPGEASSKGGGKKEGGGVKPEQQQQQQKKEGVKANTDTNVKSKKQSAKSKVKGSKKISSHPRFLRRFGGHAGRLTAYAVSPDGKWLATAGIDGKIRVNKVDEPGFDLSCTVKTSGTGVFQDHLSAISWLPMEDGKNPTIVGTIDGARQAAFFRIRHKKSADAASKKGSASSQYELIELARRRFDVSSRVEEGERVIDCLADQSHPNDHLVLTKVEYDPKRPQGRHPNTVAWDGEGNNGREMSGANVNGPRIRISPDGMFLCGGGGMGASEAKIYEVRRKKVKGRVEPVFDSISSKHAMTLIPRTTSSKVADVAFCGEDDVLKLHRAQLGILACEDGTVEVWDLDVDFRNGEDPKFVCSANLFGNESGGDGPSIVSVAASVAIEDSGEGSFYRVAAATSDSALHLLSYRVKMSELVEDFVIEESHRDEGVGRLHFCPSSGNALYSTGENNCREVYSWRLT